MTGVPKRYSVVWRWLIRVAASGIGMATCAAWAQTPSTAHGLGVRQLLAAQRLHEVPVPASQRPAAQLDGATARLIVLKYRESFRHPSAAPSAGGGVADGVAASGGGR